MPTIELTDDEARWLYGHTYHEDGLGLDIWRKAVKAMWVAPPEQFGPVRLMGSTRAAKRVAGEGTAK